MTGSEVFVGHYCPTCNTSIELYVVAGGPGKCPGCGGPLQAAPCGPQGRTITNFTCGDCGHSVGLMVVQGGDAKCPGCGTPID